MVYTLNCKGTILSIQQPIIMGIINATPDSFFADSRTATVQQALATADKMLQEGATILDIGGQSTRPGALQIGASEECDRVLPVIEALAQNYPNAFLSIDTYHASVAQQAVQAGAHIVNDVSGGLADADMLSTIANLQTPYILMHMQGNPQTMQNQPHYNNLTTDLIDFFIARIDACEQAGIKDLILDPGFGFGKTLQHNYTLLQHLHAFQVLQYPVLAGLSRKSMIYKPLNITAEQALNGTSALHMVALQQGASILRVHDVKAAAEVIQLFSLLQDNKN